MKKKGKGVIRLFLASLCVLGVFFEVPVDKVQAGTVFESPYVNFSPDGFAWTVSERLPYTDYYYNYTATGNLPEYWYETGTRVETGIVSSLRELDTGEHYYLCERRGEVPIKYWEVAFSSGKCIHDCAEESWHGVPNNSEKCHRAYYSGWFAYCADCEEQLSVALVYMSKDTASSITSLNMDYGYYYVCPINGHIENTYGELRHDCQAISFNRYKVVYDTNVVNQAEVLGEMEYSLHMYNNETVYEGQTITPISRLSKNIYRRTGYTFVGWNTKPDGSGTSYADGAEIFNLSVYDCNEDPERGTVTLYAQWVPSDSTLRIDPAGGSYNGNSGITIINKGYGNTYFVDPNKLICPKGFTVSFNTAGGNAIEAKRASTHFNAWVLSSSFHGRFQDNMYAFLGDNGSVDTLTASYEAEPIILPTPAKQGYSFGGWYEDAACTKPIGFGGEEYSPKKNITLYAKWVELLLSSYDNYITNNRKGAVDLRWSQPDTRSKSYKLYESKDGRNFSLLYGASETITKNSTEKEFAYKGTSETYTVPYSGFYTITAQGAQGKAYSDKTGGKGGKVTAKIYLTAGEKLTVTVGGQNGYNGGGSATAYGNGGGSTTITSNLKGTLLIAGGGGGASMAGNGGEGGSTSSNVTSCSGEKGPAGGGGGHQGGSAGNYVTHSHVDECLHKHTDSCYGYTYCGSTEFNKNERHIKSYRCDRDWSGNVIYGDRCGGSCNSYCPHDNKTGHCVWDTKHTCKTCNTEYTTNPGVCTSNGNYDLVCQKTKTYVCGYDAGQVISSTIAHGGSSYVNTTYVVSSQKTAGVKTGNGAVSVKAESVGFMDAMTLNGVAAPDKAAPDKIREDTVMIAGAGDKAVLVTFEAPADNGTQYFYKAESYTQGTENLLCTSNITTNTLTTGVVGYYYIVDTNRTKTVTADNAQNKGAMLTTASVRVLMTQNKEYLHIAAVDGAGNVGATLNLEINAHTVSWKVSTDKISVSSMINGTDYKSVHLKESNSYYVRADGETPFMMSFNSYLHGDARTDYQVDYQIFDARIEALEKQQRYITRLPYSVPIGQTAMLDVSSFVRQSTGNTILTDAMNTGSFRERSARDNHFHQAFTIKKDWHGQSIYIVPVAGAGDALGVTYSEWSEDVLHGVTLIADGEPPVVSGAEVLEGLESINRRDGDIVLNLHAQDGLSGLREFKMNITNTDSGTNKSFVADEAGNIVINITSQDSFFSGTLVIEITAIDNVGNTTGLVYGATEFELQAQVRRILEPHEPVFKCGESGVLEITAWGYVDKIEVEFPQEILAQNPELNKTYIYKPDTMYMQQEKLQFMIPLYTLASDSYIITVRAYKGDIRLEEHPALSTITVDGSVVNELRTRLR